MGLLKSIVIFGDGAINSDDHSAGPVLEAISPRPANLDLFARLGCCGTFLMRQQMPSISSSSFPPSFDDLYEQQQMPKKQQEKKSKIKISPSDTIAAKKSSRNDERDDDAVDDEETSEDQEESSVASEQDNLVYLTSAYEMGQILGFLADEEHDRPELSDAERGRIRFEEKSISERFSPSPKQQQEQEE